MTLLHIPLLLASVLHLTHIQNNKCEVNVSRLKEEIKQNQIELKDWQTLFDVGEGKEELLLKWSEKGDLAKVNKLLKLHTNVSAQDSHLRTSLHLASFYGHLDVVRALLDAGAKTEVQNKHKNTPLIWAAHNNQLDICRLLLDRGAQINASDLHRNTPLHYASWFGYLPIVQLLVERGADVNARNENGRSPKDLAELDRRSNVVTWLQNH